MRRMSDVTETPESPLPEEPAVKARRWPHPLVTGLAGLAVGAAAVGLAWGLSTSGTETPKTFTLRGTMTLTNSTPTDTNYSGCTGSGGYDDIATGASVTVYAASGQVVGSGALGAGRYASTDSTAPCVFKFAVPGVPENSKFYQVEVSHRGKVTVSAADAKAGKFAASLG